MSAPFIFSRTSANIGVQSKSSFASERCGKAKVTHLYEWMLSFSRIVMRESRIKEPKQTQDVTHEKVKMLRKNATSRMQNDRNQIHLANRGKMDDFFKSSVSNYLQGFSAEHPNQM